jgi:flagellar biosynthesis anti-sigma factor FlgM
MAQRPVGDDEASCLSVQSAAAVAPVARRWAVDYDKAVELAANAPDVDAAKVHRLKAQLRRGAYRIGASDIAAAMLQEAVRDYWLGCELDRR